MLFHLEFIPRENWGPADSPVVQKKALEWMDRILKSGKVKESGFYADDWGGFLIIDVDSPEELFGLIAPILDNVGVISHPLISAETLMKLSQEMAQ